MTTYTDKLNSTPGWPLCAALGAGISIILTALGTMWDLTDNESGAPSTFVEYLPYAGMVAVATAVVFGLVVRTATQANARTRGVVLSVLGVLSIAVFWTGFPMVLAAGAIACIASRRAAVGRFEPSSLVVAGLTAATFGLAVWLAIAG
jgi:hypothetical protein